MSVKDIHHLYRFEGLQYRFARIIPIGHAANRYVTMPATVTNGPWIDAINRLLRAEDRVDPRDKTRRKRWTQNDLSDTAGIRPNTLSEIMNARREPSIDSLDKIATALNVPIWAMFVSERQADVLTGQQAQDTLQVRRESMATEVRQMVTEALAPIAERLTEAAIQRLSGEQPQEPVVQQPKRKRA